MGRFPQICLSVFSLLVASGLLRAAPVLSSDEVVARHEQALQAIRSVSAAYSAVEEKDGERFVLENGTYAYADGRVLIRWGEAGKRSGDTLFDQGMVRGVWRNSEGGRVQHAATKVPTSEHVAFGDLYQQFQMTGFPTDSGRKVTLADLYRLGGSSLSVANDTVGSRECVKVSLRYGSGDAAVQLRLWHDVGYGYLVVKKEMVIGGGDNLLVAEVSDFQESQGVFFPGKCQTKRYRAGKVTKDFTVTATNVKINPPLRSDQLKLPPVPSGTKCTDYATMQVYPIDSDWKQSGPATPHIVHKFDSGPPDEATEKAGNRASQSEEGSWTPWIIGASVAILLAGGVLYIIRKVRSARQ